MNKNMTVKVGAKVMHSDTGVRGEVIAEVSYRLPGTWFDVKCSDGIVRMYNESAMFVCEK